MRRVLAAAAGVALLPALAVATPSAAQETAEPAIEQWRGYWVDAFNEGIYTADQVTELVADAQQVGANALVVQVGRRFDCFCNDALYPRTDAGIAAAPYDPLAEVIEQAHAAGIEVHAWVNATTLWNSPTPPTSPDHAFNAHGLAAEGRERWLNKRADGVEKVGNNTFIDPAHPDAVDYVVDAVGSIVDKYDVDGVNLDYIRYPDYNSQTFRNDWGYSETSLARFAAETGRTDIPAPDDEQFSQWRRAQVTALVRKIYLRMYEADRADRLSINGVTYAFGPQTYGGWENTRPYAEVMQDWKGWLEEGVIDTVTAMNYKREWLPDQAQMFEEWNAALAEYQGDRQNVIGPALYLNEVEDSVQQAKDVAAAGVAGWMGYSYANPSRTATASGLEVKDAERDRLEAALRAEVFTEDAVVPVMDWKETPSTGHLAGTVTVRSGETADQVDVVVHPVGGTPGTKRVVRTDGSGWFGAVDLAPGRYRLQVVEPGAEGIASTQVVVTAGAVTHTGLRTDALP